MSTFDQHPGAERIQAFVRDESSLPPGEADEIARHVSLCDECHARADEFRERLQVADAIAAGRRPARNDCPDSVRLESLVAGLLPAEDSRLLLDHVAACDRCGAVFKNITRNFDDEMSAEERQVIDGLSTSTEPRQALLAKTLSERAAIPPRPVPLERTSAPRRPGVKFLAYAAAAVVAVAGLGWWVDTVFRPWRAGRLIATAYGERRTIPLRFPGAAYGPVRQMRGSGAPERPTALAKAEGMVGDALADSPASVAWLRAKARIELLEWHSDAALATIKSALSQDPDSVSLLIDMASAHYERAQAVGDNKELATAVELLGKALAKEPANTVALFNRALAYERLQMKTEAIHDWERYLQLDAQSPWAAEAREQLNSLKQTIRSRAFELEHNPGRFLARMKRGEDIGASRPELYMDLAVTEWLPLAYQTCGSTAGRPAAQALGVLSQALSSHHNDYWLADITQAPYSPRLCRGLTALSHAVRANLNGDATEGARAASEALDFFRRFSFEAGSSRAALELTYARNRASEMQDCSAAASGRRDSHGAVRYPWIVTQYLLERSMCLNLAGKSGEARAVLTEGMAKAAESRYETLRLRALGLIASLDMLAGDDLAAWKNGIEELTEYWSAPNPPMRAYQFYGDLGTWAETRGQGRLALALAREGVRMAEPTGNLPIRALAHYVLATNAYLVGEIDEAKAEFKISRTLFSALPPTSANETYVLYSEMNQAILEARDRDPQPYIRTLSSLRPQIVRMDNTPMLLRLHSALAALLLRAGEPAHAEAAYRQALQTVQQQRRYLRNGLERARWHREAADIYRGLVAIALHHHHDPEAALALWRSYLFMDDRTTFNVADSGSAGSVVLAYVEFEEGLAVWSMDGRGNSYKWIDAPRGQLDAQVDRFKMRCANPESRLPDFERDGAELYRILIAPMQERIAGVPSVGFALDGSLSGLPMQALIDGTGAYLGDRHVIFSLAGSHANPRRHVAPLEFNSALVVASPTVRGGSAERFPPLADAGREAELVTSRFRKTTRLEGEHATVAAFIRAIGSAEVFHFAGHGMDSGEGAALVLAPSTADRDYDLLDASDVPPLLGQCRLAVLSACSSAKGEGALSPDGLASAFLRAGADTVIATRWDVDSRASTTLVDTLYAGIQAGRTACAALQDASAALRMKPEFKRPYYWAPFDCFKSI